MTTIRAKNIKRQEIQGDYTFWCNLRSFQTSAIICRHRKELRRKGCCGCKQILVQEGLFLLDVRSLKPTQKNHPKKEAA
jgi:hypothetical protein